MEIIAQTTAALFAPLRIDHPVWMLLFLGIVAWIFRTGYRLKA